MRSPLPLTLLLLAAAAFGCKRKPEVAAVTAPADSGVAQQSAAQTGGSAAPEPSSWSVVLVQPQDELNVRAGPGVTHAVVNAYEPTAAVVETTGRKEVVGESLWREVRFQGGTGWVNSRFLTPRIEPGTFAADPRPRQLLERLAEVFRARGDLTPLVARRGLYVMHFGPLEHHAPAALPGLLQSAATPPWHGPACDDACLPPATFHTMIGAEYLRTWAVPTKRIGVDEWLAGGNRSAHLPVALQNFRYLSFFDAGDEDIPNWRTWVVFFEYEGGEPKVVALATDQWSP